MSVIPVIKPKAPDFGTSAYWDFTATDYRVPIQQALNFSRSSSAWYWNEFGVLTEAAANELRIDHDPATVDTSVTAHEMSATVKRFALSGSVVYIVGSRVRISYTSDSSQYMIGTVISSAAGTVRIAVDRVYGAGTYSDWTLIEVKGLLIEEQRTNLLLHSQDFSNAAWVKDFGTVDPNTAMSPDGTGSADLFIPDVTVAVHRIRQTVASSVDGLVSFYVKDGGYNWVKIRAAARWLNVNLSDGSIGFNNLADPFFIEALKNGWYRISIRPNVATGQNYYVYPLPSNTNSTDPAPWPGDGVSGVYIWQADAVPGDIEPSSPIPTTTAQVTRSADVCTVDTLSPWFNASEGTVYIESDARNGEQLVALGSAAITADADGVKKYTTSYNTDPVATSLDIGYGTHKNLRYYPRELTVSEQNALKGA